MGEFNERNSELAASRKKIQSNTSVAKTSFVNTPSAKISSAKISIADESVVDAPDSSRQTAQSKSGALQELSNSENNRIVENEIYSESDTEISSSPASEDEQLISTTSTEDKSETDNPLKDNEYLDEQPLTGIRVLTILSMLTVALVGFHYIQSVFTPVFLALTLVLAFRPIGRFLIKHHVPAGIAMMATFITLMIVFIGIVSATVWALTPVPETLLNYSGRFEETINQLINFANQSGLKTEDLTTFLDNINYNSLISWAWTLVDSLSSIGGLIAIVVISLFFISIDTVMMQARSRIARQSHSHLATALAGFEKRVRSYWIISTVFGLIVAVIDVFALEFMGIPLALTWGLWAFITNYIPNIGFIIGVLPPMLMALLDQGWQSMVWVAVLYSVINVVIQTFIQPKFTGDVVGLSPTVTFLSLVIWTVIVGLLGSILAVPLTLFFKALLIDSDPRTHWLDVYLVSEKDARKREAAGWYDLRRLSTEDIEDAAPQIVLHSVGVPNLPIFQQNKQNLQGWTRKLKRSTKNQNRTTNSSNAQRTAKTAKKAK